MRVAMVSEHASPLAALGGVDAGGQNVHVAALATELARRGHEVVVYTRRDSPDLDERVPLGDGVTVEHLDAGPPCEIAKDDLIEHVPAMAAELRRRLPRFGADVVHAHFWMSGLAALDATADLDLPLVQTFHALGEVKRRFQGSADTSPPCRYDDERRIARSAERIIASCTDEMGELVRLGAERARIDIVPSGVDLELFTPQGNGAPRNGYRRVVTIGRLVPRKGVDDVIRALSWLPDTELLVIGGPDRTELDQDPEAVRLRELSEELGLRERVHLLGRVGHAQLPRYIRSADVVACLPWYEPFGIVPLEAMACGVPVVGTAVGGLLDSVTDGVTGLLLPPSHEPRVAAQAIRRLLDDERLCARLGRAGCERAADYSWQRVAHDAERTYVRAVLAGRGERRSREESVG